MKDEQNLQKKKKCPGRNREKTSAAHARNNGRGDDAKLLRWCSGAAWMKPRDLTCRRVCVVQGQR